MAHYIALIDRAADGSYGVVFPDVPGCTAAADTFEAAVREASEALAFHVQAMREAGEDVPAPRALEDIRAAADDWYSVEGAIVAMVPLLPPPGRAVRVNITLEERLLAEIDAVTKNRSAFLADAARRALRKDGTPSL
jgi:predicted RNase H-like HicB family nuclease